MTNQALEILKYYNAHNKFFDLAGYLNSLSLENIFLSKIKDSQNANSFSSEEYKLHSSLSFQELPPKNSLWEYNFRLLDKIAYQNDDNELSSFIKMCLKERTIPIKAYTNLSPQGCILKVDYISYLGKSLLSAQKELTDQRLWAEWGKNSQNFSGLINLIKKEGIYIQSPQWQYEKSLNVILKAIWRKDIIISLSPKTYYDIFKRKLYQTLPSFPYKDNYEWQGKRIDINISLGIPEKILVIASPQSFVRKPIEPLHIKKDEREAIFQIQGKFELFITEKDTSGIIQLIT